MQTLDAQKRRAGGPRGRYNRLSGSLAILPILLFLMTGCSKDEPPSKEIFDLNKDIFFTINLDGKTYTSYGYHMKDPAYPQYGEGQTIYPYAIKGPSGEDSIGIEIVISSKTYVYDQSVGNCNVHFFLVKPGRDTDGVYRQLWQFQNKSSFFIDDGKTGYLLDSTGVEFNVSYSGYGALGGPWASGNFTCKLYKDNPAQKVTATGSFRLARPF
jgi:hypothetical protein